MRADLRKAALGEVRVALVQRPCDCELQDAVAQELEPLIGIGAPLRPGGVRERASAQLLGQRVDERSQRRALLAARAGEVVQARVVT